MLIKPGYYPDPRNDHAFRCIYGDPKHSHVLRHLLNSVLRLRGNQAIHHLRIADPHQTPRHPQLKDTVLDVDCWDQCDQEFIVEMQLADERDFDKRALFYTAKAYTRSLPRGGKYKDLRKVTLLSVLGFHFLKSPDYLSTHLILNKDTGEHRLKNFEFVFLELSKFSKTENELATMAEKWTHFFKHASTTPIGRIPAALRMPEIEEAFEVLEEIALDDVQRKLFEKAEMDRMDRVAQIEKGYDDGLVEGEKKGREEGEKKGLAEGEKKGREEGEKYKAVEIARNLLKSGMDAKTAATATGLSLSDIERLCKT